MKVLSGGLVLLITLTFTTEIGYGPGFLVEVSADAAKEIEDETGIVNDTILLNRIKPVAQAVMRASDLRTVFECKILNTDVVNAFALPVGPIYVTSGLITALDSIKTEESRSMLAGILGHELAHIALRHSVAMLRLQNFIKAEASSIPEYMAEIMQKGYSREQEFEADEYGVIYAMRAGYDFESIVKFYKKMRELYGETPPGDERYDDHPRATERIARLYEVRAQLERDFDQWNLGLEAINESRYNDAIKHFKLFTSTFTNSAWGWTNLATAYLFEAMSKMEPPPVLFMTVYYTEPDFRLRGEPEELSYAEESFKKAVEVDTSYNLVYYGNMAIIYALKGKFAEAIEFTKKALEANQAQHFFYNNWGNILYLQKDYKKAEEMYKKAISINNNWPMPKFNLAMTYEAMDKSKEAIGVWKDLLGVSGYNREAVKHLSRLDKKFKPDKFEIEPEKKIGDITIGMTEDSVIKKLGAPNDRITLEKIMVLEYSEKSLVIFLRNGKVSGILAQTGFKEKTSRGIGIGSSISELCNTYGLPDDIVQQKNGEQWVYGKYGLLFNIYEGTVSQFQIIEASKDG